MATFKEKQNFCFPLRVLANDRVKIVPLEVEKHGQKLYDQLGNDPSLFAFTPSGPYDSKQHLVDEWLIGTTLRDPGMAIFAIIDKTRPGTAEDDEGAMAGTLSFMRGSVKASCVEIGYVYIMRDFQRTHVATNAVGLMMGYALRQPAATANGEGQSEKERGGLGLARLQWRAHAENKASVKLAERMGFVVEGVTKWDVKFAKGRVRGKVGNGKPLPPGSDPDDLWRDSVTLSLCWDAWADGGEKVVEEAMNRRK